jgi:hypothetical protein
LKESPRERHSRGDVGRVAVETVAADTDRVVELSGAAVFLGELRKRNRRRVCVDPASKVFDP